MLFSIIISIRVVEIEISLNSSKTNILALVIGNIEAVASIVIVVGFKTLRIYLN